jgi:hypothetical protein
MATQELQVADGTKQKCGAKARSGNPCGRPAGWGTPHPGVGRCKMHGGSTPTGIKSAQNQMAATAVKTYGLPVEIDPHEALLEELHRTAGHVAWLRTKIAALEDGELHGPVGGGEHSHAREEPHVWVRLYQEERVHLTRIAKVCVEVGIEERRVRLAERMGELFAGALQRILEDLGVADHPEAPKVVRRHLQVLEGGQLTA